MQSTNKSLGLQMALSAFMVMAIGLYIIAHPIFHISMNLVFGFEIWKYYLLDPMFFSGLALILIAVWMGYRAINYLRM